MPGIAYHTAHISYPSCVVFQPLRHACGVPPLLSRRGLGILVKLSLFARGSLGRGAVERSETERLLKYKKIRQQTSFLLGRMLPYPWCHLNYRHSVPVTLCALPVESTAAITSGARLPLLPAMPQHPGVQGEAHGGSFKPGHLCGSHLPALSGRGRSGPYFSRSSLFMQKLYHCFLSVSTSAQQFLQVCAACPSSASFAAQLRHKPYKTLPSHCSVKPCSAIRWARTSSMKWQSR